MEKMFFGKFEKRFLKIKMFLENFKKVFKKF